MGGKESWIDGSFKNDYGKHTMGIGVILKENNKVLYSYSGYIQGQGSSNKAEYLALIHLLNYLIDNKINDEVIIRSDSRLLVNQMNGWWGLGSGTYIDAANEAIDLALKLKNIKFKWTSRTNNKEADKLSKS